MRIMQNNFNAGELSPLMDARIDQKRYGNGCRRMLNMIPLPHGPATSRMGLRWMNNGGDHDSPGVLLGFRFSVKQAYVLELFVSGGQGKMHIYRDGMLVEDAGAAVEVDTPYSDTDKLPELKTCQSGDMLYIWHPSYGPRVLSRTSHTDWTLNTALFVDGPYMPSETGDDEITFTPSAIDGSAVTVTASEDFWEAGHVGGAFRIGYVNPDDDTEIQWGYGLVTAVNSATVAVLDVKEPFGFQYITDEEFETGIPGWSDMSSGDSDISHDATNQRLVLTNGTSGYARGEFEAEVTPGVPLQIDVDLEAVDTRARVYVGKTTGAYNILAVQEMTAAGLHTFTLTPQVDTVFVTVDIYNTPAADTATFNKVSLVKKDLATSKWREGAWNDKNGYPGCGTFYQLRMVAGGSAAGPQKMWFSRSDDFTNFGFSTPTVDDDGITYTIAAEGMNTILWMLPMDKLLVGTGGREWTVSGTGSDPIGPASVDIKPQTKRGSSDLPPLLVGDVVLFVQRQGNVIREFQYSLDKDGYTATDLSILSEHLLEGRNVVGWDYQQAPYSIVWMVLDDGALVGCTYQREHEVVGWHRHESAGAFFESVCCIPGEREDEVWVRVRRTVNGQTRRFIERMDPRQTNDIPEECFYVDSGLSLDVPMDISAATQAAPVMITSAGHGLANGDRVRITKCEGMTDLNRGVFTVRNATTNTFTLEEDGDSVDGTGYSEYTESGQVRKMVSTIGGLGHLVGETVQVLADGIRQTDKVVVADAELGGVIDLDQEASHVHVGLGFNADMMPMKPERELQDGPSRTKVKNISKLWVMLYRTVGLEFGPSEDELDEADLWDEVPADEPWPMISGDYELDFDGGWETDGTVLLRQSGPLPLTITGLVLDMKAGS